MCVIIGRDDLRYWDIRRMPESWLAVVMILSGEGMEYQSAQILVIS